VRLARLFDMSDITFDVSDTHPKPEHFMLLADRDACSPKIQIKYGGNIGYVKLRVYPDFAVIVMGPRNRTYKHMGKLDCDELRNSGKLVYCVLTGDDDGRICFSVYDKIAPRSLQNDDRKCLCRADFDIFNVWEGSWYVKMYMPGESGGRCMWDVSVTELDMTSTDMKLKKNGTVCETWPIRNPDEGGFLAVGKGDWGLSFDIRFDDFYHTGFFVSVLNKGMLNPKVQMRLIRKM
jgi:hypothetical protein